MSTMPKPSADGKLVSVHRSFGTAFGFNEILTRLERWGNYQFQRFLIQNKIKGRWKLMIYVSQEGAGEPPEVKT